MNREDARFYLKSSGFSEEQIDILERTDLKPCPFCGGNAIAQRIKDVIRFRYSVRIGCSRCWCAITKTLGDYENADINDTIKKWNTRTTELFENGCNQGYEDGKPRPCRHKKDIRHSGAGIHKDRAAGSRKGRRMNYIIRGELQDERITASIYAAKHEYENGEIIEARDRLMEIAAALDEFIDTESEDKE